MCGIAGQFNYCSPGQAVDEQGLLALRDSMVHRGPDDAGIWISEELHLGLVHRRLSILDLSEKGRQPMATPDGLVRIVFNGEIYNFRSLRRELEDKGYQFRSNTDTEVLLYLYQEKGLAMVHELRGMYAFAIWDEQKQTLALVRDPFGIKPLYYADTGTSILFASEVKALRKLDAVDTAIEPAGAVGFFLLGHVPEPYTLHKGIRQLPAGSTLEVARDGRCNIRTFCDISEILAQDKSKNGSRRLSEEEWREQFSEALRDTIEHHLIADVPTGFFLSAGLDSSMLVYLASRIQSETVHTVSLGFDEYRGTEGDETKLAEETARTCHTTHQTRWIGREDFSAALDGFLSVMDQPTIDGLNTYFVSRVAREAGLTVAISGLGGDELFGSYPSFTDVPRAVGLCSRVPNVSFFGKWFRVLSAPLLRHFTSTKYAGLFEYGSSYEGAYLLRRGLFMPWELPDVLDPEIASLGWQELEPLLLRDESLKQISSPRAKVSALEMKWYMRNRLLRDADWAGMAHSLEIRVPFVDLPLLRSLSHLLPQSASCTKNDLFRRLGTGMPESILNRQKTAFHVPVHQWLFKEFPEQKRERGWRGWARRVYDSFGDS